MKKLILASTSVPRKNLLQRLLVPFDVANPDVDETILANETAYQLVERLSIAKAQAVALQFPNALIIGADQVGVVGLHILCKPLNYENAVKQLTLVSGKAIDFLVGVCLLDTSNNSFQVHTEIFSVIFRELTPKMIADYLKKEQPYQSAGSCNGDGLGIALIKEFKGNDYSALIGLPLIRLVTMLENAGLNVLE